MKSGLFWLNRRTAAGTLGCVVIALLSYYPVYFHVENDIGTRPDWTSMYDVLLWNGIALCIFAMTRRFLLTTVLYLPLFYGFQKAASWKISHFGSALTLADLGLAIRYISNVHGTIPIVGGLCLLAAASLFVARRDKNRAIQILLRIALSATILIIFAASLVHWAFAHKEQIAFREGYHRKNAARAGALFYLLYLDFSLREDVKLLTPTLTQLTEAYQQLDPNHICTDTTEPAAPTLLPNVYIFNIESLFDLKSELPTTFSQDPFYESFRATEQRFKIKLLVGTRGGGSASTQYEAMCGLPSLLVKNISGVESALYMKRQTECIPRILGRLGYDSTAWFPSATMYFGETEAFASEGFTRSFTMHQMRRDDLDGPYISDSSLYRQALEYQRARSHTGPHVTYFETTASHIPFPRNLEKRPDVVGLIKPSFSDHTDIANRYYYSTKELMEFIDLIQREDPLALFVVLGDHRPMGFVEDAFRGEDKLRNAQTTIVSFIGPWKAEVLSRFEGGYMASYEIPSVILQQIGGHLPKILCAAKQSDDQFLRTVLGDRPVVVDRKSGRFSCSNDKDSPACINATKAIDALKTVASASLFGIR